MSDFLKNLQNAVEEGKFNSEAAKKITEIGSLADEKLKSSSIEDIEKIIKNRLAEAGVISVSEEEVVKANIEYEKLTEIMKKRDMINKQLATLIDIEDMVKLSIDDMFDFISNIEENLKDDLQQTEVNKTLEVESLLNKIIEIKSKYN